MSFCPPRCRPREPPPTPTLSAVPASRAPGRPFRCSGDCPLPRPLASGAHPRVSRTCLPLLPPPPEALRPLAPRAPPPRGATCRLSRLPACRPARPPPQPRLRCQALRSGRRARRGARSEPWLSVLLTGWHLAPRPRCGSVSYYLSGVLFDLLYSR
nr:atherin-like isoform X2 [Microcebus murinus]